MRKIHRERNYNIHPSCANCYNCILVDKCYMYEADEYYYTYQCYLTKTELINNRVCDNWEPDWHFGQGNWRDKYRF